MRRSFSEQTIKYAILILAAASCAFGLARGESLDVLHKAAAICLECCGIG